MEHFSKIKLASSDFIHEQNEPVLVTMYKEDKTKGQFTKYVIDNFTDIPTIKVFENELSLPYDDLPYCSSTKKHLKRTQDLKSNCENLQTKNSFLLTDKLLQLIMTDDWENTTFISQDSNSENYVRIYLMLLRKYFYFARNLGHFMLVKCLILHATSDGLYF